MLFSVQFFFWSLMRAFHSQTPGKEIAPYIAELRKIKLSWGECGKLLAEVYEQKFVSKLLESPTVSPALKTSLGVVFDHTTTEGLPVPTAN